MRRACGNAQWRCDDVRTVSSRRSRTFARTRRGPIEYKRTGSGPAVLVLKGGHSTRDTQLGHEDLAENGFTVIEASRPGYDDTPASVGCSAQDQADALAELLDVVGIRQAHVVAISAAGHVGIELARRHPDRVDRISFESAVALPWSATTRGGGRVLFGPLQSVVWSSIRTSLRIAPSTGLRLQLIPQTTLDAGRVVRDMDDETRGLYLAAFRSLWSGRGFVCDLGHDSRSNGPILRPTLILRGINDRAVPPGHASRLVALAPQHELVEVDAESHFIWFGRAAGEVWDRRLAFLRG
jgi:pimeloyl-ACP methyl ester carboxylesterase